MINRMNEVLKYRYLPIFRDIPDEPLMQLGSQFEYHPLTAGETVFRQGEQADRLFILLTGKVIIRHKTYDGALINVASILPGWVFGWSAALGRKTFSSAAQALLPGSAFSLTRRHLLDICSRPGDTGIIFLDRLTSVIADRLNQTPKQILDILANMTEQTEG
jgi:CRP/FNR family cyclic AMP-dependent transcriptional regulator